MSQLAIAVKENIDVRDMLTTGGNPAFAGTHAPYDATVVRLLREARGHHSAEDKHG